MKLNPLFPTTDTLGINTDLYELTMAAAYFQSGRAREKATFELFTRKLPPPRTFLIAAGLEQALHYLTHVRFDGEAIRYLKELEIFESVSPEFFEYLADFSFSGEVWALPEGTPFFANQPILQVQAPIIEAQIVETFLINTINFQSMVASKAARICLAAKGRRIADFGSRRAHSPQAGVLAARAAFIGGCDGTSNVLAGYEMGIPVYGTMAHSFVQFFDAESEAFERFYDAFKENTVVLVDTYDTLTGVERALELGQRIGGVRMDSGDLLQLAFQARDFLDRHGHHDLQIVASGNLDEEKIHSFTLAGAPIDAYGVGTDLVVSQDAPTCDLVYKLVEVYRGREVSPRIKASEGKSTLPFRKQIFRTVSDGLYSGDLICGADEDPEPPAQGELLPLLEKYVEKGRPTRDLPDVFAIREQARTQLERLPRSFKLLHTAEDYPVQYSRRLLKIRRELERQHTEAASTDEEIRHGTGD